MKLIGELDNAYYTVHSSVVKVSFSGNLQQSDENNDALIAKV